jgi:hypothetical protein
MTNAPVGGNYVNIISLMQRATRLSPETQVTLGGYYGVIPPPPKWSHFHAKMNQLTRAKFVLYSDLEQRFEQGVGSLAEGAREPEIAYASERIRPFSLASNPAGHPRKSNSPN